MHERRSTTRKATIETRADGKKVCRGYAAVFFRQDDPGTEFELWDDLVEQIMPTAFDRALREKQDVRALFNHDSRALLGRLPAGTLRMSTDLAGLLYEIDLPDTQAGRDVAVSVERGDLTGSSFAFAAQTQTWVEDKARGVIIRQINDCDLFDVGPVTYPAYEATTTSVGKRSREDLRAEFDRWKSSKSAEADAVAMRLQMLRLND